MKLTTAQILAFKARYENRFDDEVITTEGAFRGMTVKVAQQIMINLDQPRYVDWLIEYIDFFSNDPAKVNQVYDEYYNDATYALYAVKHHYALLGATVKERYSHMEQPPVDTYTALDNHRARYGYVI